MKRLTPYKKEFRPSHQANCCGFSFKEEAKTERIIQRTIFQSPRKIIILRSSKIKDPHTQNKCSVKQQSPLTPRNSNFTTRNNSKSKNLANTATSIHKTLTMDKILSIKTVEQNLNPLQRLRKRMCGHNTLLLKSESPLKIMGDGTFKFSEVTRVVSIFEDQSQVTTPGTKHEQINFFEVNEQNILKSQIQKFKEQYRVLLMQYSTLKQQKQQNLQLYKSILANLKVKQQQIRQLQILRGQQVRQLRDQLQNFINQRQMSK